MQYPIDVISERFSKMEMDEKPVRVVQWPEEDEVKAILDVLKTIDDGYDLSIHSWGPPTTGASMNFFVQAKQAKAAKKRALDTVVSRGLRKGRGTKKGNKN